MREGSSPRTMKKRTSDASWSGLGAARQVPPRHGWHNADRMHPSTRGARTLLLALAVTLGVLGSASALGADPSPAASPGASALLALPEGIDPAVARRMEEIVSGVPALRGLDALRAVPFRTIDSGTFRAELEALLEEEMPAELAVAEEELFTRLGLLDPEDDLRELVLTLYEDQALAYYDPRTGTITIVGELEEIGPTESIVLVHEYVHALQDQHWDIEGSRIPDPSRSDAILAQAALIEGDATLLMYDWAAANLRMRDLLAVSAEALGRGDMRRLEAMPPLLRRQLVEFPYLDGYAFANAIRPRMQGYDAIDGAWGSPPLSTEQILHPERYPGDVPVDIVLPDVALALGEGWTSRYEQTLGEMQMGVWMADGREPVRILGLPGPMPGAGAVDGWDGDRLVSLDGPDGHWAVVWQTAWDSRADADEFAAAAKDVLKGLPGAGAAIAGGDVAGGTPHPVAVVVADSSETRAGVRAALGLD
jgi:hypothetical protein